MGETALYTYIFAHPWLGRRIPCSRSYLCALAIQAHLIVLTLAITHLQRDREAGRIIGSFGNKLHVARDCGGGGMATYPR